jgi:hypothetical protein
LGVNYTTGNGKFFGAYSGGVNMEFFEGESTTKWNTCHEYGHFLGLSHPPETYGTTRLSLGTYSLMHPYKLNEVEETVTPLSTQDIIKSRQSFLYHDFVACPITPFTPIKYCCLKRTGLLYLN